MRDVIKLCRGSLFAILALVWALSGCGGDDGDTEADQVVDSLAAIIGELRPVELDTAALASDVRAGRSVRLPFAKVSNDLVQEQVSLTLHNLRNPELTVAAVKDGVANSFETLTLPPPATYQGFVQGDEGVAVFTINEKVVEGDMLISPEGWSIIEPLEPLLRQHDFNETQRAAALAKYNHVVYNVMNAKPHLIPLDDDNFGLQSARSGGGSGLGGPLVFSMVADGDAALYRAYPPDGVMPFWLKQETLLNVLDWLFNCIEPDEGVDNAYTRCDNEFDGGHDGFQAKVRIDSLEVWKAGGPDGADRETLLYQSIVATHQASPPCCGPPHTAGRSSLVNFFSGKGLLGGAGEAAGIGGLNIYDEESCVAHGFDFLCHHQVSQLVAGNEFPGSAFYQQLLTAHEIGHVIGGREQSAGHGVCWLFGEQCGTNLMGSLGFSGTSKYLFTADDAVDVMGPLMRERLEEGP